MPQSTWVTAHALCRGIRAAQRLYNWSGDVTGPMVTRTQESVFGKEMTAVEKAEKDIGLVERRLDSVIAQLRLGNQILAINVRMPPYSSMSRWRCLAWARCRDRWPTKVGLQTLQSPNSYVEASKFYYNTKIPLDPTSNRKDILYVKGVATKQQYILTSKSDSNKKNSTTIESLHKSTKIERIDQTSAPTLC